MIPKLFKIANQEITVDLQESLDDGEYGKWSSARSKVYLAKKVEEDGELIDLTDEQIENTFYHELIHVFQFFYNNEYDEAQAQVYANFMREFLSSQE